MNQTWKNGKKPKFGTNFGPSGLNLALQFFFVGFTYTSNLTLLQAIILCILKKY